MTREILRGSAPRPYITRRRERAPVTPRLRFATRVAIALAFALPSLASAQSEQRSLAEPPRYLLLASSGAALRITQHDDFGQERLAPAYLDLLVGYVPEARRSFRHGFGLGVSTNLGRDGGYSEPLYTGDQLVVMPAYLGVTSLGRDLPIVAHLGLPIVVRGGTTAGLEIGAAIGYRLLAGTGVFAELDVAGFAGALSRLNVIASLELGLFIDFEVLP